MYKNLNYGYIRLSVSAVVYVWVLSMMIYQKTTTLICLELQLVHHFIEGTGIDTTDVKGTVFLLLLVLVQSNCLTPCQSKSHITTDNQSASPSWCQAPIWDPRPICLTP
jgi:hypothetical protein